MIYDMMLDMNMLWKSAKDELRLPYSSGIGCAMIVSCLGLDTLAYHSKAVLGSLDRHGTYDISKPITN
jgi:hypothetical protein